MIGKKFRIKVEKESIRDIIEDLEMHLFYLPSFQRDFVWDEDDIKEFIDSIIKGLPVGSIILWKPSKSVCKEDMFKKPLIGSPSDEDIEKRDTYYIIDGQQRLTALLLLCRGWRIERDSEEVECKVPISIHIKGDSYTLYKSYKIGIDLHH